ncbi:unnamed protein product [Cuscuta epithymum]|uniref:ABC transporter domain-containing protein n=1 Tax=Cuscuta epithymum TaxID=186058 RepID=A0AAV0CUT5_9ASTE|nr:unnamed protein product [Cuscuta epithymum]CAH9132463.1 unnamed protein product [Cuscuta epithymum]
MLHTNEENIVHGNSSPNALKVQQLDPSITSSKSNVSPCSNSDIPNQHLSSPSHLSVLQTSSYTVILKFEDVAYSIKTESNVGSCFSSPSKRNKTRVLLNGVSGTVNPGELLAMLGPSGSGKTTLLTALAGRLPGKISGTVSYNGQPLSSSMKRKIGFVSQDDVLYPHLTVKETLTYAALLRLPKKLSKAEKTEQAELVIRELGLTRCRNSMIGGALFRGISGGERKRVSIGQEMLVNPSLLLLDEPTSGLDSTTAQRIVATLRWLARGGRTVVTTIHQPSSRLFRMFDKVLVLSDGCPIYSGRGSSVMEYFGAMGFVPAFSFMNPADFLLDLANGIAPETRQDEEHEVGRSDSGGHQNSIKKFLISSYSKSFNASKEDMDNSLYDSTRPRSNLPSRSRVAVLLFHLLGVLPYVQRHICIPTRTANANKRTLLRNVPPLLLLLRPNRGRSTNGTHPSNHLCDHSLLDGRPKAFSHHILSNSLYHSFQCVSFSKPRADTWRDPNGRQEGCHSFFSGHVGVLVSWWVLHSEHASIHHVDEVCLF